jgi:MbtH protein
MSIENDSGETTYEVVMNDEEQYSIWPAGKNIPNGWRKAGRNGTKEICLEYISSVWTDMRPLSLRKQMAQAASH